MFHSTGGGGNGKKQNSAGGTRHHQHDGSTSASMTTPSGSQYTSSAQAKSSSTSKQTSQMSPSASSTSTSSSGSSGTAYTGTATFFYQGGVAGACGTVNSDSTPLVALQTEMYGSGSYCGKTVVITNKGASSLPPWRCNLLQFGLTRRRSPASSSPANGKSVTATVQDECPGCSSSASLDLSTGAFDSIGDEGTGELSISWYFSGFFADLLVYLQD
ncbi:SPOSA6832_00541, partial [Sporobolomyces salmonicolor]